MVTKAEILTALSPVREYPLVKKALGLIDLKASNNAPIQGGAYYEPANEEERDTIILFPTATAKDVTRVFGKALLSLMDDKTKQRCKWFLTTVSPDWRSIINLNWPDRDHFPTYEKLIEHHNTPVSKLCTLIICNAFIANHVSREDSYGVDLCDSPYVQDFVNGDRYYPIYPLVTAYAPQFVDNFQDLFSDGVEGFKTVKHTEVQKELSRFLESVLS